MYSCIHRRDWWIGLAFHASLLTLIGSLLIAAARVAQTLVPDYVASSLAVGVGLLGMLFTLGLFSAFALLVLSPKLLRALLGLHAGRETGKMGQCMVAIAGLALVFHYQFLGHLPIDVHRGSTYGTIVPLGRDHALFERALGPCQGGGCFNCFLATLRRIDAIAGRPRRGMRRVST